MNVRRLKKGDKIGIISPANFVTEEKKVNVDRAIEYFNRLGLEVVWGKNSLLKDRYAVSGGSPKQRAEDINELFADKSIKCIWSSNGGDTSIEVLSFIDFELIKKNPKLFLGMSNIDLLSMAIHKKTGMVVFNAPDPKIDGNNHLGDEYSRKSFEERIINGVNNEIESSSWKTIRPGKAEGKLIGCNLPALLNLAGTEFFPELKGNILFLETYSLNKAQVISALNQLKLIGVFEKISALVVGHVFSFEQEEQFDADGKRIYFEDLILNITDNKDFPILKIDKFGHYSPNVFLPIGFNIKVDASDKKIRFLEKLAEP